MDELNELDKKFHKELSSGITALILLGVLNQAERPMYGYQIARLIEDEQLDPSLKQGVLYPVLRSLESSGLLESQVEPSVSGPPRRYYSITPLGRETLVRWLVIWNRMKTFIDTMVKGTDTNESRG